MNSNSAPVGCNGYRTSHNSKSHTYRRAYKACHQCRKKKARCIISPEEYAAGQSCTKCRRELRDCTFPAERFGVRDPEAPNFPGRSHRQELASASYCSNENAEFSESSQEVFEHLSSSETFLEGGNGIPFTFLQTPFESGDPIMESTVTSAAGAIDLIATAVHRDTRSTSSQNSRSGTLGNPLPVSMQVFNGNNLSVDTSGDWELSVFVRLGWLTAERAMELADFFFREMLPLSQSLDPSHVDRNYVIREEPFLCCVILTLSSRYLVCPSDESAQTYLVHEKLWGYCQTLLSQILLGNETYLGLGLWTVGSVSALLLLLDWHPISFHMSQNLHSLDLVSSISTSDLPHSDKSSNTACAERRRAQNVTHRARKSERMSSMLLGCAFTMADDLGLLCARAETHSQGCGEIQDHTSQSTAAIAKLLYFTGVQHSLRVGSQFVAPQNFAYASLGLDDHKNAGVQNGVQDWNGLVSARAELATIARSVSNTFHPSLTNTCELLRTGRYRSAVKDFHCVLRKWEEKHLEATYYDVHHRIILAAEYYSALILTSALGLRAMVESNVNQSHDADIDEYITSVIDGSLEILQLAVNLAERQALRYAPVNFFTRTTIAAVLLVKGLAFDTNNIKLELGLTMLRKATTALRGCKLDSLHTAAEYVSLLEDCINCLVNRTSCPAQPPGLEPQMTSPYQQGFLDVGLSIPTERIPPEMDCVLDCDDWMMGNIGAEWPDGSYLPDTLKETTDSYNLDEASQLFFN